MTVLLCGLFFALLRDGVTITFISLVGIALFAVACKRWGTVPMLSLLAALGVFVCLLCPRVQEARALARHFERAVAAVSELP